MTAPVPRPTPLVATAETALTWFRDEALRSADRVLFVDADGREHVTISLPALRALVQAIDRPVLTIGDAARAYQGQPTPPAAMPSRLRLVGETFLNEEGVAVEGSLIRMADLIGHAMLGRRHEVLRQLDEAKAGAYTFAAIDASSVNGAFHPGQLEWDEATDFVVAEAAERGVRVVLVLFNDASEALGVVQATVSTVVRRYREHPAVRICVASTVAVADALPQRVFDDVASLLGHEEFDEALA
jgi:hypothetical protein